MASMHMRPLRWTEWFELAFRLALVGSLVWFASIVRDLSAERRTADARTAWAWAQDYIQAQEQRRLLGIICRSQVTVYDAKRGVCDPNKNVEVPAFVERGPIPAPPGGKR